MKSRLKAFKEKVENPTSGENNPFLETFLKAFEKKLKDKVSDRHELQKLASWLHGSSGALGVSFFEKIANGLCGGRKIKSKDLDLKISKSQIAKIGKIIQELNDGRTKPNLKIENKRIFSCDKEELGPIQEFTFDVFCENDSEIFAIELKTVKPNKGEGKSEKGKILRAKAALKNMYPTKRIRFYLGFPFDPYSSEKTGFDKDKFIKNTVDFNKFFDKKEILLAGELWEKLSGEKEMMTMLLEVIGKIATTNFETKFAMLLENNKKLKHDPTARENFKRQMDEWYLLRPKEKEFLERYADLTSELQKGLRRMVFSNDGKFKNGNDGREKKLIPYLKGLKKAYKR